jgi:hypothetical protein
MQEDLHYWRKEGIFVMLWKVLLILCSVMIVIAFIGCKKEGPAEKAGRQIDKAVEKTGDKLEEAGNKVKDATKK